MPRIDAWLAEIGLAKYASVFRGAEIDFETLPELVEEDLKELALPLGPRRKIWGAISRLKEAQAKPYPDRTGGAERISAKSAAKADAPAERRHLTVMFVDLVGSTAMSARFDAEDMRLLIAGFQSQIAEVVGSSGGYVAQFLGDGVLCYFGWPHANEDDTERAVRAGLKVIETVNRITAPDGAALAVRVGVATGVVIVGDLMMNGAAQEAAAVGETTNLAARLQGIAGPNRLVVSGDTLPLLGAAFVVESLGEQALKGLGDGVEAFLVKGETAVESRFAARRPTALTPIVGRDREIGNVLRRWSLAQSGQGQMVLLRGEAGIGKSRIVQTIADAIASDRHTRVTYQCSPYHSESAFYPVIRQMSYRAGIEAGDTNDQRLNKLEAVHEGTPKTRALMASFLGLDGAGRYGEFELTPAQQRAQLMKALLENLREQSREKPLLLVVEDVHWIDPTSLELLELVLEELADQRIMVLATTRPSFDHEITAHPLVTELSLTRLDEDMTRTIASKMAGGKTLPDEIMRIIARRTDGVPLFVEELTKSILESGALKEDGAGFVINGPLRQSAIPATLHDSLMARLDRLGRIKEIAQIASCVGREFGHQLMVDICELPEYKLDRAFEQLIEAGLIHRHGSHPAVSYSFKHALVRDAAYDGLLKDRRKIYHERILTALEATADTAPELLATHAEAARLTDRAIDLWEAAGRAAIARPAYKEAEAHLRRAIALNMPSAARNRDDATADQLSRAVVLQVQLFMALSPGIGLWADETVTVLEDALALAERAGGSPLKGDIISGMLLSTYFRGSLESSLTRAAELAGIAAASGDIAQSLTAKRITGIVHLSMGRFAEAVQNLGEAAALCEDVNDEDLVARFGHDPTIAVKAYQSFATTFQGKTQEAEAYRQEAKTRASKIKHINTTAAMFGLMLSRDHVADDVAAERRHLKELQRIIAEHSVTASHLWAEVAAALLRLADGDVTGVDAYRKAEETMLGANIHLLIPGYRILAARRIMALGLMDEARDIASGVEPMMAKTGEKSWLAEYHRLRAAFALHDSDAEEAERQLETAIDVAADAGAVLWELRAAIDLAALLRGSGREAGALASLVKASGRIAPGDCPREMEAAAGLISELRGAAGS